MRADPSSPVEIIRGQRRRRVLLRALYLVVGGLAVVFSARAWAVLGHIQGQGLRQFGQAFVVLIGALFLLFVAGYAAVSLVFDVD